MSNISRRNFIGMSGAAAAAFGLAACGGGSSSGGDAGSATTIEGTEGGGVITVGTSYATENYHPSTTSSALSLGTNWHVVEGLYGMDFHDYTVRNELATGDPVQVDETTYEISIREGAKYSDGTDVTVEDVISSFGRTTAEGSLYIPFLSAIDSLEKKDDTTITVKVNIPNFSLLKERLSIVRVVQTDASDDDLTAMPIGSGPWAYESIDESLVKFVPNEYYNGDVEVKDTAMEYHVLVDDTARTTAQQEGTTLVMENVPADTADQIEAAGCRMDTVQGFATCYFMFDVAKEPWNNVKVRQAVLYALDMDTIITNALGGKAAPATCFLPDNFANYHEASTVYTYDPDKAKALLEEAGVTPGSMVLSTTDHGWIATMAATIQQNLEAIGFTCEINSQQTSAMFADIDQGANTYDIAVGPGDPSCWGNDPDLLMNWWFGDNVWMQTRCPWKDSDEWKQLNELMTTALGQTGDEQQATWNECFDILADNVPLYLPLHKQVVTASWSETTTNEGVGIQNFEGIGTTGVYTLDAYTVTE